VSVFRFQDLAIRLPDTQNLTPDTYTLRLGAFVAILSGLSGLGIVDTKGDVGGQEEKYLRAKFQLAPRSLIMIGQINSQLIRHDVSKIILSTSKEIWDYCKTEKYDRRSRVQRFRGSRFHSRPWTAFGMRINEKSISFGRPNPKFGAKLKLLLFR
jgi:hypothetical protein